MFCYILLHLIKCTENFDNIYLAKYIFKSIIGLGLVVNTCMSCISCSWCVLYQKFMDVIFSDNTKCMKFCPLKFLVIQCLLNPCRHQDVPTYFTYFTITVLVISLYLALKCLDAIAKQMCTISNGIINPPTHI